MVFWIIRAIHLQVAVGEFVGRLRLADAARARERVGQHQRHAEAAVDACVAEAAVLHLHQQLSAADKARVARRQLVPAPLGQVAAESDVGTVASCRRRALHLGNVLVHPAGHRCKGDATSLHALRLAMERVAGLTLSFAFALLPIDRLKGKAKKTKKKTKNKSTMMSTPADDCGSGGSGTWESRHTQVSRRIH